jgi:GNAT superfamily N-acetyltransferase
LEIREVKTEADLRRFIDLPSSIYRGYPLYVPQLRKELKDQFSPVKNPFFRHAEASYYLAEKDGAVAGRVASVINRRHAEFHNDDDAGFFGFFESVDDPAVASALLDAVAADLKAKGMKVMRGPMNFSTNEECGFLLEGYEERPMLMTPYNPPYYHALMEACNMEKSKDLYAYIKDIPRELPEKIRRVADIAGKRGITVRPVDKSRFRDEMLVFREVYNDAWEHNWGFIPLTDAEIFYLGERLKQIAVPELTLVAEDKGTPVGFLGMVPDFNVVLKAMNGRLNPLSILKGLYYSRKITDLRLLLLGIKKAYRNKGVDALMLAKAFEGIRKKGDQYRRVEFSWILEDNIPVQRLVEMIGGSLYKRYRIYEKLL